MMQVTISTNENEIECMSFIGKMKKNVLAGLHK